MTEYSLKQPRHWFRELGRGVGSPDWVMGKLDTVKAFLSHSIRSMMCNRSPISNIHHIFWKSLVESFVLLLFQTTSRFFCSQAVDTGL